MLRRFRLRVVQQISGRVLLILAAAGMFSFSAGAGDTITIEGHHSYLLRTKAPIIRASVADPRIADVKVLTPTQVLVVSKSKTNAATNLIVWTSEEAAQVYDIVIRHRIPRRIKAELTRQIAGIAPDVRVEVLEETFKPDERQILLKGSVESQEVLNQVLTVAESFGIKYFNLIRLKGPQQVQLKVVLAEISRTGLRQMGINILKADSSSTLGLLRGGTWEGTIPGAMSLHSPFSSAFEIVAAKSDWLSVIGLLKNQGLARTLASPTLVTMNGQKAEFLVGGEYPIPVQGDQGSTSIEYKKYGIMLSFTPFVIDRRTITLEVSPEVSTPDYALGVSSGGSAVPGLSSRKATTTLQLRPGQTFVMAGLLKEEYRLNVDKVPFLGDLPLVGGLFSGKETEFLESELIVVVTPELVAALDPADLPELPGQETISRMGDFKFFFGHPENESEKSDKGPEQIYQLKGRSGFIK